VQDLALGLVEPCEADLGPELSLFRSLWMATCPLGMSIAPHCLVSLANLLSVHSIPLLMSLMKMWRSTYSSTHPWESPLLLISVELLSFSIIPENIYDFFSAFCSSYCRVRKGFHVISKAEMNAELSKWKLQPPKTKCKSTAKSL